MVIEYPRMLYRDAENCIVNNLEEETEARADDWGDYPAGHDLYVAPEKKTLKLKKAE